MEDLKLEDFRPLKDSITSSRTLVRGLMNAHYDKIKHDEKRLIAEMNYFIKTFKFMTKKWNVEILYELEIHKGLNFNEMTRHLKGVSSRSLSDCLKELEKIELITRTVQEGHPPKVLYDLTEKGKGFIELSQFTILYLSGI